MRGARSWLAASMLVLAVSGRAGAELIDLGAITRDTLTNLDWLDLTETQGLSMQDIEADAGGFASAGWRPARTPQVCSLFRSYAGLTQCPVFQSHGVAHGPGLEGMMRMLGLYEDSPLGGHVIGIAGWLEGGMPNAGQANLSYVIDADDLSAFVERGAPIPRYGSLGDVGNYLVRAVPEPATSLSLALGLAALARVCRRPRAA